MLARLKALPLFVLVMGLAALSMLVPAVHATLTDQHHVARAFFYSAVVFLFLFGMVALAISPRRIKRRGRSHLISLVATFTILPVMLAVPFVEAIRTTTYFNAYFEMVSALTTTGATLFAPERLPSSVHLWRAQVGWCGGFFVWVTAVAILAPMNLGGFEVRATHAEIGQGARGASPVATTVDSADRLLSVSLQLLPIYSGLTVVLWAVLYALGELPLVALCHAMSVLSTSGISPLALAEARPSGFAGEAVIFVFLIFGLSRLTFAQDERPDGARSLLVDPELRIGALLILSIPTLLLFRHWIGAIELDGDRDIGAVVRTFWGGAFTVMSYLTTTGFQSGDWEAAQMWSGLETPGLILMGLALIGGGVATTAGGVKLLRVYALYKHGLREMEKLIHPHSVGGAGQSARRMRRQGAYVAWVFFMLFAISISAAMAGFALAGANFDEALVLTMASLTTTGPLVETGGTEPILLAQESVAVRSVFAVSMVVGRLETLAIIALLNPDFWRG